MKLDGERELVCTLLPLKSIDFTNANWNLASTELQISHLEINLSYILSIILWQIDLKKITYLLRWIR